jgi:hypothetical protein
VTLDLADDRRCCVRRKLDAALELEPVHRLDQADCGDLDEVVEWLAAIAEPTSEVLHQRQVQLDDAVPQASPLRAGRIGGGHPGEQLPSRLRRRFA